MIAADDDALNPNPRKNGSLPDSEAPKCKIILFVSSLMLGHRILLSKLDKQISGTTYWHILEANEA